MVYEVTYTTKMGLTSSIIVKARNAQESLKNAANLCFTGKDFRNPIETKLPYKKPRIQGIYGRN